MYFSPTRLLLHVSNRKVKGLFLALKYWFRDKPKSSSSHKQRQLFSLFFATSIFYVFFVCIFWPVINGQQLQLCIGFSISSFSGILLVQQLLTAVP